MTKIDYDELAKAIQSMSTRTRLYKVLKTELGLRGWWKARARWQPPKGRKIQKKK